jgi:transposase-like protein
MLRDATDDITANTDFPMPHWKKIWSTNPLERLDTQISRHWQPIGRPTTGPPAPTNVVLKRRCQRAS